MQCHAEAEISKSIFNMIKRTIFWVFFSGLLIVVARSFYVVNRSFDEIEQDLKIRALQDKADIALRTLDRLKHNDTNIVSSLESQLDLTIIELGDALKMMPESRWDTSSLRLIRGTRDYYKTFPGPQLDPALVQAFSLLNRSTNN